ncbi:Alpha/Beta hydrolase protein [Xylariaceae sp. FL0804]|nr:Alpha/Beta hydrolase protein [Xylariaceae sp. FL0804]
MGIDSDRPVTEGEIGWDAPGAGKQCTTWYKVIGDLSNDASPLLAIHGGPGGGHEYLSPLHDLYDQKKIPVILYDQIGCGRSTHLPEKMGDTSFWTFDLFLKELDTLVDHLELRKKGFNIFGQSWGGMLGGTYASSRPVGLQKLIIASGPGDIPVYQQGCEELLAKLPDDVRKTIEDCERRGDFESPEFEKAAGVFYSRHMCRIDPMPDDVQAAFVHLKEDPTVYKTMCGPSEFTVVGSIKDWKIGKAAANIDVKTLLINGKYDEVQDATMQPWFREIPQVKWVTLDNSSHMLHWEERERAMQLCADFLTRY